MHGGIVHKIAGIRNARAHIVSYDITVNAGKINAGHDIIMVDRKTCNSVHGINLKSFVLR